MTEMLALARWLVHERGFSVIPLDHPVETTQTDPKRIGKVPALSSWKAFQQSRATDDNLQVWFGNGHRRNIGIVTGVVSGVVVVDLDSPAAIIWADRHLPLTAMVTRTANGEHRFYRHPGKRVRNAVRIRTDEDAIKIDVRGDGGYVVAPGSVHPTGVVYERVGRWPPILELPLFDESWLESTPLGPSNDGRVIDRSSAVGKHTRDEVVRRARAYLAATPPAIEGQGGDDHTFHVCCIVVRDFGLDDRDALDVLREWNSRCEPPWDEATLQQKIDGARKYGTQPIGARLYDAKFGSKRRVEKRSPRLAGRDSSLAVTTSSEQNSIAGCGVGLQDFYAYMPMHRYVFAPSREMWPAVSVNSRIAPVPLVDDGGHHILEHDGAPKMVKASVWLDRHQSVEQITWAPGLPMIIRDRLISEGGWLERVDCSCFNLYRPAIITQGDASAAGPWRDHLNRIYPDDATHIVSWLAHRVQRPYEKINHALVLGGLQGIGKDTLLEPVKAAVGPWNFIEVSPAHLLGRFNGFVKSVILRISEARDLGDVDRYSFYDHMKTYTAAPPDVLRVDEKNLREYSVGNVCGVVITTNHKTDGLYLPADDRRHYVAWSNLTKEDFTTDYWKAIYGWYAAGGDRHVAAYLATYDLSQFDSKAPPPKTAAFWDVVDANRTPEDAELADALDKLLWPNATTLAEIAGCARSDFAEWLRDRKNSRQIPHRLEAAGYVAVRNSMRKDGLWRIDGRRQAVYVKQELPPRDRLAAAQDLVGGEQ